MLAERNRSMAKVATAPAACGVSCLQMEMEHRKKSGEPGLPLF